MFGKTSAGPFVLGGWCPHGVHALANETNEIVGVGTRVQLHHYFYCYYYSYYAYKTIQDKKRLGKINDIYKTRQDNI